MFAEKPADKLIMEIQNEFEATWIRSGLPTRLLLALAFAATLLPGANPSVTSPLFTRTIAETGAYAQQLMAANDVEGLSVALIDHEEIVWAQGFGWADRAANKRAAPDTVYHIGSVSKVFVTAAVMALVADGKVDLDAPVIKYVPAFRLRSPGFDDITVRMLLNHQSGMPGSMYNWSMTSQPVYDYIRLLSDWLPREYRQYPARFASVYTNNGFELAEEVVAAVSGRLYLDFLRQRILDPLAMKQTGVDFMEPALAAALSKAYLNGKEAPPENVNLIGTGGIASTPTDLCRLLAMFNGAGTAFGQRVLTAGNIAEMARDATRETVVQIPQTSFAPGLGWDHQSDPGLAYAGAAQGKGGDTTLFGSYVIALPAYSLGCAVTLNKADDSVGHAICLKALAAAIDERYGVAVPKPIVSSPPATISANLTSMEGSYGSAAANGVWQMRTAGQTAELWLQRGSSLVPMFPGLGLRADGWLATSDPGSPEFTVNTIGVKVLLLIRITHGYYQTVDVIGEKLGTARGLSPAWLARLGKTYVAVDTSPVSWGMGMSIPAIRLAQRSGWLAVENLAMAAGSGAVHTDVQRLTADRLRNLRSWAQADPDGTATNGTLVYHPVDDQLASVPMQVDCRDVTYLQVQLEGNEEWLRTGNDGSLWRPLDGIAEADTSAGYATRIRSARASWVKLPLDRLDRIWTLRTAQTVRWVLFDDRLQPLDTGWGPKDLRQPEGSSAHTLYLVLYSMTDHHAAVRPRSHERLPGGNMWGDSDPGSRPKLW